MSKKNHMEWSWIFMVLFMGFGVYDYRIGILGLLCMALPILHALMGRGKIHCRSYCPRGSIFGKWLPLFSFQRDMPAPLTHKNFKRFMLIFMLSAFGFSLYQAGWNFEKIAFSVFRFMVASTLVGVILGVFFKPRSWCVVCPMGTATGIITQLQRPSSSTEKKCA